MEITLTGLKKWMRDNQISVVDMNWGLLRECGIEPIPLFKWEMRGYKGSAKADKHGEEG